MKQGNIGFFLSVFGKSYEEEGNRVILIQKEIDESK